MPLSGMMLETSAYRLCWRQFVTPCIRELTPLDSPVHTPSHRDLLWPGSYSDLKKWNETYPHYVCFEHVQSSTTSITFTKTAPRPTRSALRPHQVNSTTFYTFELRPVIFLGRGEDVKSEGAVKMIEANLIWITETLISRFLTLISKLVQ